jgi:3-phenylpropionate/cinnamic acid dioxygenase small subunit
MNTELLQQASTFIWMEGDMLDHAEYDAWLALWTADGEYVIPIDPCETNFQDTLNYAYDDDEMRRKRIARLISGESISTTPTARTVRNVSRLRILEDNGGQITVRCAQDLREFRKGKFRQHTADVTYKLQRSEGGFRIRSKVIQLINSTDTLTSVGFIL